MTTTQPPLDDPIVNQNFTELPPGIVLKKERLQAVVDLLPEVFTLGQLVDRLELLHRVDTGIAAIERGEGIPHEVVMARLQARVEAAKNE